MLQHPEYTLIDEHKNGKQMATMPYRIFASWIIIFEKPTHYYVVHQNRCSILIGMMLKVTAVS